jgi:hypothetical protein
VFSEVAFRGGDLADLEPGTVYTNDTDPDGRELVGGSVDCDGEVSGCPGPGNARIVCARDGVAVERNGRSP